MSSMLVAVIDGTLILCHLCFYHCMPLLHHPSSNQMLDTPSGVLRYRLERSRRRSVGFRVSSKGLEVRAPMRLSMARVEQTVLSKWQWIQRKMHDWQNRALVVAGLDMTQWTDGGTLQLRGQCYAIVDAGVAQRATVELVDEEVRYFLPIDNQIKSHELITHWLKQQARTVLQQRLAYFAPQVGVEYGKMRLSSAKTRWGSASGTGTVSLHWRLVQLKPELLDYVVVHELCHFHEMNHSPRFWAHVARVLPNYRTLEKELKETGMDLRA